MGVPPSQLGLFDTVRTERPASTPQPGRAQKPASTARPGREEQRRAAALPVRDEPTPAPRFAEDVEATTAPLFSKHNAPAPAPRFAGDVEATTAPLFSEHDEPAPERRLPEREEALLQAASLARRLAVELGAPVHLRLTDNRATLVSFRRVAQGLRLRVHHLFLEAPDDVVRAIARYAVRSDASAGELLEAYARDRQGLVRRERRPGKALRTRGRCYDLRAVQSRLNADWFDGRVRVDIGWARRPSKGRRRTIHLGGYDARLREIRIHPALDRPHVPAFVVDYLVFHSMLHADLHEEGGSNLDAEGRCTPGHSPAFLQQEDTFPLRDTAQRWLQDNHTSLLRG
ncbi:hypothetical protein [Myxococcus sp. CA039A]|uniref:hypothetical protein n=1 Tax=Myxococcus sp. CA039A TaxID=2741737 RepID=UPI00157AFF71|nr:hypothetical protein [Myxococcus sp. CA039A]NTX50464.1 hypothetical protein [Myxococcus sp. CA039A]